MKASPRWAAFASALLLALCAVPAGAQTTTSYSLNLNPGTSAGGSVTNMMIFETGAAGQLSIDFGGAANAYHIAGSGLSVLSHTSAFTPQLSLIIGLTQAVDKVSIVVFMNDAFAASATGMKWSDVFGSTRHNEMITRMLAAQNGSSTDMNWFRDVFFPVDGARAAFAPGGSATAMEFTVGVPIGRVPEHGSSLLLLATSAAALLIVRARKTHAPRPR